MKMHVPQPCSINDTDSNTKRVTNRTNPGNLHGHVHRRRPRTCLESNARFHVHSRNRWHRDRGCFSYEKSTEKKTQELPISFYPYCDSIFFHVKYLRKKYWCYFSKCDVKQNGFGGARRELYTPGFIRIFLKIPRCSVLFSFLLPCIYIKDSIK